VYLSAAVGAFGAVDPGPYATRSSMNTAVNLVGLQVAFSLQKLAKPVIFVLFRLCLLAYLDKIESHNLSSKLVEE
jgi:hypothetical protein